MTANSEIKAPVTVARPLSPHLQIYKPQLTSGMSIFHRITGVALSVALPVVVAWLVVLAGPPSLYDEFTDLFQTRLGEIVLIGFSWAFFYHFCCGVRHLFWDAGYGLSIDNVYRSGYIALGVSVLATLGLWLKVFGVLP